MGEGAAAGFDVDVRIGERDLLSAMAVDVSAGLRSEPKELAPKWFYDDVGCALFEAITRVPEYYPTRCEREILAGSAEEIARLSGADTLVELGSGTSEKTRLLLGALAGLGQLRRFVPFDVSEPTLRAAGRSLVAEYPGVEVHAIVGDFERHLDAIPRGGRRVVAFLGGTIGNLAPPRRRSFLSELAATLEPGDGLILGTDLVKEASRLQAAYDDAAGVTAAFNRNLLCVLNRRLGADFVPFRFDHVAAFDPQQEWVEMRLRSTVDQEVHVPAVELAVEFGAGEQMRTEISAKFRRAGLEAELADAGLELARWWTDRAGDFAVSLSFAS
ncbi:MAG: L-histidine N(alpha)-methyltransferase [Acidimicrobiales bacterium]